MSVVQQIRQQLLAADAREARGDRLIVDGVVVSQPNGTNPRITPLAIDKVNQLGIAGLVEALDVVKVRAVLDPATLARLRPGALYTIERGGIPQRYYLKHLQFSRTPGAWVELILQSGGGS